MRKKFAVLLMIAAAWTACSTAEQKLAVQHERDPQYQYEKAVVCMNARLTDEALKYLALALSLDPNHFQSYNLRGLAYLMKGSLTEAQASFERCVQLAPNFSDAQNNLGTVLQEKGDTPGAEAAFRRAYAIDGNYNAAFNLAKIDFQKSKLDEALDYVQHSLGKFPRSLMALNLQGLILESQNKFDEAIASYDAALRVVVDEPYVLFNQAVAYYKKNDSDKAKALLDKTLRLLEKKAANGSQDAELKKRIYELLRRIAK
ncbi:MAG: tetratricopeptide repeat protein [Candidatus Aminicenantales bacterium]